MKTWKCSPFFPQFSTGLFLLTQLSEVIFYAAPGVFGDEGFDQTPWLLPVFHVGIDPESKTDMLKKAIA